MTALVPRARTVTLVADGTSDHHALSPLVTLLLDEHSPVPYRIASSEQVPHGRGLAARLSDAMQRFPCDLLLVHRDAEDQTQRERESEISAAVAEAKLVARHVNVVPVRMTEAWLLADEGAIRSAVGNPAGVAALELPPAKEIENVHAKDVLFRALERASGLGARRRRKFDPHQYRHRVAEAMTSLGPVRRLASFRSFEAALIAAVASWSDAAV